MAGSQTAYNRLGSGDNRFSPAIRSGQGVSFPARALPQEPFQANALVVLGIANALLLGSIFLPQFSNWREPMNFASIGVSGVLGLLAAHRDRRLVAEDDL
jgi:hypothetical protein